MSRRICSLFSTALAAAAALVSSRAAHAAVIYGDIAGNTILNGYNVGPTGGLNNAIAEGFTMTGNYTLNSVDLMLSQFTPNAGSNLALSIYSDNGNKPGVDLYDLSTNVTGTTSGTPTLATFSGTGSFPLVAGTKYWLDFYATNPSASNGNIVQWNGVTPSGPTGPAATDIGQERSIGAGNPPSGSPNTTERRTAFQLNGVAVPEPSALVLLALGSAAAFLVAARRGPLGRRSEERLPVR